MNQAKTYEELKPLVELVKAGRLLEVMKWIASGNPVNWPPTEEPNCRKHSPLTIAIESGFHDMVQVLLEAGAPIRVQRYNPMDLALKKRRLDIIKLLMNHGASVRDFDAGAVLFAWNKDIIDFFVEQGMDLETRNPMADALCYKNKMALGICKKYVHECDSFREQLNIALRHHVKEGNKKWIELMLWAGADPYSKGPDCPYEAPAPGEDISAVSYALLYKYFNFLKHKSVKKYYKQPDFSEHLYHIDSASSGNVLIDLLKAGFNPAEQHDRCSQMIENLLCNLYDHQVGYYSSRGSVVSSRDKGELRDCSTSRERMKMIHLLARNGGYWQPKDEYAIKEARKMLRQMKGDYTLEFLWIMTHYRACDVEVLKKLLDQKVFVEHVGKHIERIGEMVSEIL